MALFVGWHYVKQGYGMLMVDAVLKRRFFKDPEKKVFLVNSYVVWIFAWLSVNQAISEQQLWGLQYYTFAFPAPIIYAGALAAIGAGLASLWVLVSRFRATGGAAGKRRPRLCGQPLPLASLRMGRPALAARRPGAPLAAIPGGRVAL